MIEPEKEPFSFLTFAVRFICGAIFGALLGLGWIGYSGTEPGAVLILEMLVPAVIVGLITALTTDDLLESLADWLWWW